MAAIDGITDRPSGDPTEGRHTLLSVLPSIALHGAVALVIWLGLFEAEQVQPPVTFIALTPAASPSPAEAPPAPVVPAPEPEIEPDPLPLPPTGMVLPQPEPAPAEPVLDFTPPEAPELESFPFDPHATRAEPEPESEDAVPIDPPEEKPKPKELEKPKAKPEKPKQAKAKQRPKQQEAKVAAPTAPQKAAPPASGTPAAPTKAAPASSTSPTQNAAISDAPVRISNPNYAGACPIAYPERARRRNQQGTVVIHALIGPDGKPIEVTVAQSSGHKLLDEAAQEAIAECAFVPQKVGGRAVKAIVEIPIPFKLI